MKAYHLYFVLIFFFVNGCSSNAVWKDDHIRKSQRTDINGLNAQIIDGFDQKNPKLILPLFSAALLAKSKNDLDNIIAQAGSTINNDNYRLINQFYVKSSKPLSLIQVMSGDGDEKDYTISYQIAPNETFITTAYFKDIDHEISLLTVFGKYKDTWKLDILNISQITLKEKDAIDWYEMAKKNYDKGYLINAANDMTIALQLLNPGGEYWHYQKENEINNFATIISGQINSTYRFPKILSQLKTEPVIFRITPEIVNEGVFPCISYISRISLKEKSALTNECEEINEIIAAIYPGIKQTNKFIFYRVYEKIPTAGETADHYTIVKKTNDEHETIPARNVSL